MEGRLMNIHIISNDKFAAKFVWLIDEIYPEKSNIVYIYSNEGKKKDIVSDNVQYIDTYKEIDFDKLSERDKLFVHGFYNTSLVRFLCFNYRLFSKDQLVLIIWGADLYDARAILKEPGLHLKVRVNEIIKRKLIHYCNKFMTFAYSDFDLICQWYGAKGKQFDCIYPTNTNIELLDKLLAENERSDKTKVLLGNSATISNQHISALNELETFADKNICILCPLSYGDMKYAEEVSEYGKKLFGKNFIPIRNYMSPEDYSRLLNSVDIAVFYNNRQQATGNIEILSYLKKKIYVRSDTTTWKHYVERDNCKFFDALQIHSMQFDDFVNINDKDAEYNREYIRKVWDISEIKLLWDAVMEV